MMLTIAQYARKAGLSYQAIVKRIDKGYIACETIEKVKMINSEKYPALPKQKRGVKKGTKRNK